MSEILICPVCGYSFRYFNTKTTDNKILCPMCGHEFSDPNILPFIDKQNDNKFV